MCQLVVIGIKGATISFTNKIIMPNSTCAHNQSVCASFMLQALCTLCPKSSINLLELAQKLLDNDDEIDPQPLEAILRKKFSLIKLRLRVIWCVTLHWIKDLLNIFWNKISFFRITSGKVKLLVRYSERMLIFLVQKCKNIIYFYLLEPIGNVNMKNRFLK